ncbi:MAG: ISAs1 family transposase [Syntrophobacteraceae bacterium]
MEHEKTLTALGATALPHPLEVRPITREERCLWDRLMREHHYLGFRAMVGESLRYVALHQGQWLALLGWSAAAFSCKVRDQWIGWPVCLQYSRLPLLVNNSRFLILPNLKIKNLASRILSLNLRRLSSDWQHAHGHPVWLAETFVDPTRFKGTCYKAANWTFVGHSLGFRRASRRYIHHGQPKMVFIRPLHPRARQILNQPFSDANPGLEVKEMKLSAKDSEELIAVLSKIVDPRKQRGRRHLMISVLAIAICAIMSNARGFTAIAEWAKGCSQNMLKRLKCRYDKEKQLFVPPSEPTIRRLLTRADADAVDAALTGWLLSRSKDDAIAVDGKIIRGASRHAGQNIHLLSAFLHNMEAVIAQCQVDSKTNEIPCARTLLAPLEIEGRVITLDAMHTQIETARFITEEKKADYVLIAKDNQPSLRADIEALGLGDFPPSASECR